jgi:rhodanese-related sulfurtransferase
MRMTWKRAGALILLLAGAAAAIVGGPDAADRLEWAGPELEGEILSRAYHIDPGELLDLMWNNQLRLALLDVRDESDFNLFHLIDARHFEFTREDLDWSEGLPDETVRVVMSNDETRANEAWKRLRVLDVPNVYILDGGINQWLSLCRPHKPGAPRPPHILRSDAGTLGDEELKYTFPAALGDRYPEARPPEFCFSDRSYTPKVKVLKPVEVPGGGCGG